MLQAAAEKESHEELKMAIPLQCQTPIDEPVQVGSIRRSALMEEQQNLGVVVEREADRFVGRQGDEANRERPLVIERDFYMRLGAEETAPIGGGTLTASMDTDHLRGLRDHV